MMGYLNFHLGVFNLNSFISLREKRKGGKETLGKYIVLKASSKFTGYLSLMIFYFVFLHNIFKRVEFEFGFELGL